jgi:aspartate/tyrosine/aromatic aminotransferase
VKPAALSTFAKIPQGPPDPIFGLTDAFNKVRRARSCSSINFGN